MNTPRHQKVLVLPPTSSRTLNHPSFQPLYLAAGRSSRQTVNSERHPASVHPVVPTEIFYSDPTLGCGMRIPNFTSRLRVFDCSQLNTPPPVMSARLVPPIRPDPFGSGPYPIRDLGSTAWRIPASEALLRPGRVVWELTQEEDEAVTNLLKLHHQGDENFGGVGESPVNQNPSQVPERGL